jgi:hypothetical protein
VLRVGLVAVQHGGDVAGTTGAARGALTELGAYGGFEKVGVGHDWIYSYGSSGLDQRLLAGDYRKTSGCRNRGGGLLVGRRLNEDGRKPSRVDHGERKTSAVTLAETTRTPYRSSPDIFQSAWSASGGGERRGDEPTSAVTYAGAVADRS